MSTKTLSTALVLSLIAVASDVAAAPIHPDKTLDAPPPNLPYKPPPPTYSPPPAQGFHWSAEPRAHRWASAWRPQTWPEKSFPEVQSYDPGYVNPSSWNLVVQGCLTKEDWELNQADKPAKGAYTWAIDGVVQTNKRCNTTLSFPAQGSYNLSLTAGGKTFTQTVRVKDILIVALGDSMSSGEGAPDAMQFVGEPYRPAGWVDRQCHRSKAGPAAQAAQAIEAMDPTTSVTFISFACSGATIDRDAWLETNTFNPYVKDLTITRKAGTGILGSYVGIESPAGEHVMQVYEYKDKGGKGVPSQVEQLKRALDGKRKADVVVMSAGINDANFASMMYTCALYSDCPKEGVGPAASKMPLAQRYANDVKWIPDSYKRLGDAINPMTKRVLVFDYPNAFTGDDKKTCNETLEDAKFGFLPGVFRLGITAYEANWIQNTAGPLMTAALKKGTSLAGFELTPGAWEAFRGHGYCASDGQRWINRATDADAKQGPSTSATKGTIHPNFAGYNELSKIVVKELTAAQNNVPPRGVADKYIAASGKRLTVDAVNGLLANDWDPNLLATLRVKSNTQPRGGKLEVKPDGSFAYDPAGFVGTTSFIYIVSDGTFDGTARVTLEVTGPARVAPNPVVVVKR